MFPSIVNNVFYPTIAIEISCRKAFRRTKNTRNPVKEEDITYHEIKNSREIFY